MSNRIDARFNELARERRTGFIAYITAGDPQPSLTAPLVLEIEKRGADFIELGVPFSDPLADGAVNQRAAERALAHGVDVRRVFGIVTKIRKSSEIPIIIFTYLNPVLSYGYARFARDAARAGVDGILSLDLPPEEAARYEAELARRGVNGIFIIAPTTPADRMKLIARHARGFIYYVSRTGVTGVRAHLAAELAHRLRLVRRMTHTPIAVGFGISTAAHVRAVARLADAVVVGSALVSEIEHHREKSDLVTRVGEKVAQLTAPLRTGGRGRAQEVNDR
ncbi:MAG: tryptophan synthase subunit alpha [Candidatus Aureabacteria bacterium]|nr:tryptophan synthase subunit alpha [Candidatus Auribacterota bacterium]